jgi:hypothetical protein
MKKNKWNYGRIKFCDNMQTIVAEIRNTNLTLSVYIFPDEVTIKKFGNLQIQFFISWCKHET